MKPLIGMCVLGREQATLGCILDILQHSIRSEFEWAILDQDATPEVKQVIHTYRKNFDVIIENEVNTGIVFGHNQLISLRKPGQTYIKWDDDCLVETPGFLHLLLKALSYKDIGSALAQRPTFWMESDGRREFFKEVKVEEREPHFWMQISPRGQGVVGCVWALKGEVLDQLGYFNEDLQCDDLDMPIRINQLGLENVYLSDCVIKQNVCQLEENKHPQKGLAKVLYMKNISKASKYNAMYLEKKSLYLSSHFDPGYLTSSDEYMTGSENNWIFCQRYKVGKE